MHSVRNKPMTLTSIGTGFTYFYCIEDAVGLHWRMSLRYACKDFRVDGALYTRPVEKDVPL